MIVENDALIRIKNIKNSLAEEGILTSVVDKKQYNYEFTAEDETGKLKVLVYFGKKGIKTILQGNQDSTIYYRIDSIINGETNLFAGTNIIDEPEIYIGSDETGKGDFFGPLTVAAVFVDKEKSELLKRVGVCDSKELNDPQINKLAVKIKEILDGSYEVIKIEPIKYNILYNRFKNLNKFLDALHSEVISKLLEEFKCSEVIIDKFCKNELMVTKDWKPKGVNFVQVTKAEKYTAVAAASILARASFNKWFEEKALEGEEIPKGASTNVEKFAAKKKKEFGLNYFNDKAKLHFKTINKI